MKQLLTLSLAAALVLVPASWEVTPGHWGAALADDDDDGGSGGSGGGGGGDDDDDDDDGGFGSRSGSVSGGGGGSGRGGPITTGDGNDPISRFLRRLTTGESDRQGVRRAAPAPPRAPEVSPLPVARPAFPENDPDEIIAFDLAPEDLATLTAQGFVELAAQALPGLGTTLHRLQIAPGLDILTARATVQALPGGPTADFNHFYRTQQAPAPCRGPQCPARDLIEWRTTAACGPLPTIGMIDTGLNTDHEAFVEAALQVHRVADPALEPSGEVHGTAIAALLVGAPQGRTPGLVPRATLVAVDAFHRAGRDERADTAALLQGLALLAEAEVRVINLSLAGPPNALLERAITGLVENTGITVVAAAGNAGPRAADAFPAAYAPVISVTAVDMQERIYRRAQQGAHVELAAPGVDIWTAASISGAKPRTGTSFAAPFVTAAVARLGAAAPEADAGAIRALLAQTARDLGEPGRDTVFGHGLISAGQLCAPETPLGAIFPASAGTSGPENFDGGE